MAELQTLLKALDILNLLGGSEENMSVKQISKQLDTPESTTYRLLNNLEDRGFIEKAGHGSYALGYSVLNLARDTYEKMDRQLSIVALPIMEELTEAVAETTMISIRSGLYSTCLKSVPCKERIRFVADEKRLMPIHIGASGRAILAFENDKIINLTYQNLENPEEKSLLEERLAFTREKGYAISRCEYDEGTLGIAVPVYNSRGRVYASLSVIGPEYRIQEEKIEKKMIPALLEASRKITSCLVI